MIIRVWLLHMWVWSLFRSDVAMPVRQNSLHVWKLVVTNTGRTLREILPTLISILLTCLACDSYDKR